MNDSDSGFKATPGDVLVTLDCETVALPRGRHSLNSIRAYLETIALGAQRILSEFVVDGVPVDLSQALESRAFCRIEAVTMPLDQLPLLLLTTAGRQVQRARAAVEETLTLVLINSPQTARELWWNLAAQLKEPVLTLSLMPDNLCRLCCGTSFGKLRRWQLEQIAVIVQRVDAACETGDNIQLSDALEKLVLPWLEKLREHVGLWHEATEAGARLGIKLGPL